MTQKQKLQYLKRKFWIPALCSQKAKTYNYFTKDNGI